MNELGMSRLYTYLPKDNTALTEGLLSTALAPQGFEKYRGRTGKHNKEDVLKVLDSWEPEWARSRAISALTQPIPLDAAEDFLNFAKDRKLYSFDTKDLIKAKILVHIRKARKGKGTDPVDDIKNERLNWHRKKKHLLFQGIPHYFVETTGGKIPPEFVREEKTAQANMLYHGSPHELELLDGTKTRHVPGFVFVSPSKYHASLFALNRRKVVDALKKQIGDAVKIKGLSYGQWEDESSDKIPDETDVYIETDKPFKPFSDKQKGYVYSVYSKSYRDKIKKWKNDNGDKELLIEGKVKPDLREEIAIRYNVHQGKAPWLEKHIVG